MIEPRKIGQPHSKTKNIGESQMIVERGTPIWYDGLRPPSEGPL